MRLKKADDLINLDQILELNKHLEIEYFMSDILRENQTDAFNAAKTGSGLVVKEFPKLAKEQRWQYDPFLTDEFDALKVNLLRQQINHAASQVEKQQKVIIYFYDDRQDILDELKDKILPHQMPTNVTLKLTQVIAEKGNPLKISDQRSISYAPESHDKAANNEIDSAASYDADLNELDEGPSFFKQLEFKQPEH